VTNSMRRHEACTCRILGRYCAADIASALHGAELAHGLHLWQIDKQHAQA
jgi:hypothetical protein